MSPLHGFFFYTEMGGIYIHVISIWFQITCSMIHLKIILLYYVWFLRNYMVIFPTQTDRIKLNISCASSQDFLSGIKNIDVLPMYHWLFIESHWVHILCQLCARLWGWRDFLKRHRPETWRPLQLSVVNAFF